MLSALAAKFTHLAWAQDTPTWVAPGGLGLFVIVYLLGLPSVLAMYGYCQCECDVSAAWLRLFGTSPFALPGLGLALFAFGTAYSWAYEGSRFRFKARPENRGRLHTEGLASLCVHPNYFGDLFTYTGFALATGTSCALCVPAGMPALFVFLVIPNSDAYLATRYGKAFQEYAACTAKLIPGLFNERVERAFSLVLLAASVWLSFQCGPACGVR